MMKINNIFYLIFLWVFLMPQAQAEWVGISPSVEITQSSQALDRVKRVLFSYVTVKNTSNEALVDPVRLVITNPSIPVLNQTGVTESGDAYLQVAEGLAAGASTKVRVDFKLARVKLVFGVILENEIVQNDLELGAVKFIPGAKSRFYIYDDNNIEDNSLAGLEVIIPADALDAPETIIVSKGTGYINTPNRESISVSDVVKLEPAGLTFKKPVQLSIPFYGTANAENLYIVRHSEDGTQDYIAPDYVDTENKLVYFRSEHFTEFQVKTKYIYPFNAEDKAATEVVLKDIVESDLGLDYEECSESSNTTGSECYEYWKKALNTFIDEDKTTVYDFYLKYIKSKNVRGFIDNNKEIDAYKYIFGELDSINETLLAPVKAIKLMDDLSGIVSFAASGLKSWIGASEDGLFNQLKSVSKTLVKEKTNLDISSEGGVVNILISHNDELDIFSQVEKTVKKLGDAWLGVQLRDYFTARDAGVSHEILLTAIEISVKKGSEVVLLGDIIDTNIELDFKYGAFNHGYEAGVAEINSKEEISAVFQNIEALYILNKAFDATEEKYLVNKLLQQSVWEAYSADTPWLNTKIEITGLKKGLVSRAFEIYPGQKFEITYTVEEKGYPDTFAGSGTIIHYVQNADFITDTKETKTVSDDDKINTFVYTMTASDYFSVTKGLDEFTLCFKALYQLKDIDECKKIDVVFINKEKLTANLDENKIILFEDKKDSSMLNIILLPTIYSNDKASDSNYACQFLMGSDVVDSREKVIPGNIYGYFSSDDTAIAVDYANQKYGVCGQLKKDDLNNYVEKDLTVFIKPYVAEAELFKSEAEWSAFSLEPAIARYLSGDRPGEQYSINVNNSSGAILGENHPYIPVPTGIKLSFNVIAPGGLDYHILETDLDSDGKFELYKADTEVAITYFKSGIYDSIKIKIQTEVLGVFHEHIIVAKKIVVKGEDIIEPPENTSPELDIQFRFGQNAQAGDNVGLTAIAKDDDGITNISWVIQSGDIEVYCCNNENFFFTLPAEIPNQNIILEVTAEDFYGAVTTLEKTIVVNTGKLSGALLECINDHLGLAIDADPSDEDLAGLTYLDCYGLDIINIDGISRLTALQTLDLSENIISDIGELSSLISLTELDLSYNQVTDISSLSSLTSLEILFLDENNITDISSLSGLVALINLFSDGNKIADISSLSDFLHLERLTLADNEITDISISSLSRLKELTWLDLSYNQISNISVLSNLTKLVRLSLSHNLISDISSLSGLVELKYLYMDEIITNDISSLSNLFLLKDLSLKYSHPYQAQPLNDISSLLGLTELIKVDLRGNCIFNFSAVVNVRTVVSEPQLSDIDCI